MRIRNPEVSVMSLVLEDLQPPGRPLETALQLYRDWTIPFSGPISTKTQHQIRWEMWFGLDLGLAL